MRGQIFRNPEEGSGGNYAHPAGCTCNQHPATNEAAERPNRITVEQARAIVDALNPGLSEEDEEEYDLEWQDDYEHE